MTEDSPARKALAAAEAEVARLLAEIVAHGEASARDPYMGFDACVSESYKSAISRTEAELAVARNVEAKCLADFRAEDAERDKDRAEKRAEKAESRARIMMLVGALGGLSAAAKIVYDLLK